MANRKKLRCRLGLHAMRPWDVPAELRAAMIDRRLSWTAHICAHCDFSTVDFTSGPPAVLHDLATTAEQLKAAGVTPNVVIHRRTSRG